MVNETVNMECTLTGVDPLVVLSMAYAFDLYVWIDTSNRNGIVVQVDGLEDDVDEFEEEVYMYESRCLS